jgi:transcription antitermination factor NusG
MWHVLHAAQNCEPQVCKYLGLHEIEGYAPQFPPPPRTKPGSVRDRKRRWVFPGYVFFKIEEGFSRWDLIRWAPGVRRMLQGDAAPATLSDEVIERIRLRLAERQLTPPRATLYMYKGQRVVIESGPLRMVDAIFEKNLDASQRVQVLVQLLGRPLTVELDAAIVRAAG